MKHVVQFDNGEFLTDTFKRTNDIDKARVFKAKNGATQAGKLYFNRWISWDKGSPVRSFASIPVFLSTRPLPSQELRDALSKLAEELPESMTAENTPFSALTDLIYTLN